MVSTLYSADEEFSFYSIQRNYVLIIENFLFRKNIRKMALIKNKPQINSQQYNSNKNIKRTMKTLQRLCFNECFFSTIICYIFFCFFFTFYYYSDSDNESFVATGIMIVIQQRYILLETMDTIFHCNSQFHRIFCSLHCFL